MENVPKIFVWLSLAILASNCQQLMLPFGGYRHDISFPALMGEFRTSTVGNQQPVREFSAGFHLNPPPPLPMLQSFPINPQLFSAARNSFKQQNLLPFGNFFSNSPSNLFTPNTVRQKPESDAQDEEYRKYLKEEAEELEEENNQNDITTDLAEFTQESTSIQPKSKTFVKVNVQGKDYSYST